MKNARLKQLVIATFCLLFLSTQALALKPWRAKRLQAVETVQTERTFDSQTTSAPFDGGISLLVLAGVGYAAKKGYDKRKKSEEKFLGS